MNVRELTKIKLLRLKISLWVKEMHEKGKFSIFDASFAKELLMQDLNYDGLSSIYEYITDADKKNNIPYNVGISLDALAQNNTIMVHRTKLYFDKNQEGLQTNSSLSNMMEDGFINYGHSNAVGGSAFSKTPSALTLSMTPLFKLSGYINLVSSYKDNDTVVFAIFPRNLVNEYGELVDGHDYSEIYDLSGEHPRIKPEYMLGALLKKDNGLDEFYTRDEIVNSKENSKKR